MVKWLLRLGEWTVVGVSCECRYSRRSPIWRREATRGRSVESKKRMVAGRNRQQGNIRRAWSSSGTAKPKNRHGRVTVSSNAVGGLASGSQPDWSLSASLRPGLVLGAPEDCSLPRLVKSSQLEER